MTKEEIKQIQIDYGIIYADYGETSQEKISPTRGGGTFKIIKNIREIDYDGKKGKSKGFQIIDEINAVLSTNILSTSLPLLAKFMPYGTLAGDGSTTPYSMTVSKTAIGPIDSDVNDKYLKNITMFCKIVGGGYKKITLYNAMNEADLELAATPKSEGTVAVEVYAHWDDVEANAIDNLCKIEDVVTIV